MIEHGIATHVETTEHGQAASADVDWEAAFLTLMREPFGPPAVSVTWPRDVTARYEVVEREINEWLEEAEEEGVAIIDRACREAEAVRRNAMADAEQLRREAREESAAVLTGTHAVAGQRMRAMRLELAVLRTRAEAEARAAEERARSVVHGVQADLERLRRQLESTVEQAAALAPAVERATRVIAEVVATGVDPPPSAPVAVGEAARHHAVPAVRLLPTRPEPPRPISPLMAFVHRAARRVLRA